MSQQGPAGGAPGGAAKNPGGKGGRRTGAGPRAGSAAGVNAMGTSPGGARPGAGVPVDAGPPLEPDVLAALDSVRLARAGFSEALDDMAEATQAALDIPGHIRRHPLKAAAVAGGAGFLVVGGPRRMLRAVGRRVIPRRRDRYKGLLPDEIRRILRDADLPREREVEEALEADFAEYLRAKGRLESRPTPTAARSFWRTYDILARTVGTAGAMVLVERIVEADIASRKRNAAPGG